LSLPRGLAARAVVEELLFVRVHVCFRLVDHWAGLCA
jgi:hypothetical protein